MRTALDSNILSALWSDEPTARSIAIRLREAREQGSLVLSPPAFVELFGHPKMNENEILSSLETLQVSIDFQLRDAVWFEAGRRYARYSDRRRKSSGQSPRRLMADFLVGAHALLEADSLMTLDLRRYALDFAELSLLTIEG